jgi:hypothetical protein
MTREETTTMPREIPTRSFGTFPVVGPVGNLRVVNLEDRQVRFEAADGNVRLWLTQTFGVGWRRGGVSSELWIGEGQPWATCKDVIDAVQAK